MIHYAENGGIETTVRCLKLECSVVALAARQLVLQYLTQSLSLARSIHATQPLSLSNHPFGCTHSAYSNRSHIGK